MSTFLPTYLYIKQHNITGLKYFGKTVKSDPVKYNGSGHYWKLHIKEHGRDISTVWYTLFTDELSLTEYALNFSMENNIAESADWANLKPENGLDGGCVGTHRSESTKQKLSIANKGKKQSDETIQKRAKSNTGKIHGPITKETREKIKEARKLQTMKPHSDETKAKMRHPHGKQISCHCIKCRQEIGVSNIRKHFGSTKCHSHIKSI